MVSVDMDLLRAEYVGTNISYRELAEKHCVGISCIQTRGRKENWVKQRADRKASALCDALERTYGAEVDKLESIIRSADAMTGVLSAVFDDPKQFRRHIVEERDHDGGSEVSERIFDKFDSRAIKDLTGALKDMTYVLRNLHGIPTAQEQESQRIAAERLRIDREKADREAVAAEKDGNKTIKVVFEDGVEDLAK